MVRTLALIMIKVAGNEELAAFVSRFIVMRPAAIRKERNNVSFIDSCTVDSGNDGLRHGITLVNQNRERQRPLSGIQRARVNPHSRLNSVPRSLGTVRER